MIEVIISGTLLIIFIICFIKKNIDKLFAKNRIQPEVIENDNDTCSVVSDNSVSVAM